METVEIKDTPLQKAREAARLKREKKAAALVARQHGKIKANEERTQALLDWRQKAWQKEVELQDKISKARKALGIRKNEPNTPGLSHQIEEWKFQIWLDLQEN